MLHPPAPSRVLVIGRGRTGASHARACHALDGFDIVGIIGRDANSRGCLATDESVCRDTVAAQ